MSVITILNSPRSTRYRMSFGVSIVGAGETTAPSLVSAIVRIHHSGTRWSISITRSPLWIP